MAGGGFMVAMKEQGNAAEHFRESSGKKGKRTIKWKIWISK
jgi:hypothetical protein